MKRSLPGGDAAPASKRFDGDAAETPLSFMTSTMLQRQNINLQSALLRVRRELKASAEQLATASSTLSERENALSVFERQWASLEEQLTLALESLGGTAAAAAGAPPPDKALLQLCTPVAPFDAAAATDAALQARCARMVEIGQALARVVAASGGGDAATLAARLSEERAPLSAEMGLLRQRLAKSEASLGDTTSRLQAAVEELDAATKALQRERLRGANGEAAGGSDGAANGGGGGASAGAGAGAAAGGAKAEDGNGAAPAGGAAADGAVDASAAKAAAAARRRRRRR